jgi:formylmethanofuran dehydrogenase subunit E
MLIGNVLIREESKTTIEVFCSKCGEPIAGRTNSKSSKPLKCFKCKEKQKRQKSK